jgi:acetoin utilization deacetylase AcuC-like enzyme
MARDVGSDEGAGFNIDVPLQEGSGDGAVRLAFDSLLLPVARAFSPQLVLVSAGYDPQDGDLMGGLAFSQDAFQWMAAKLAEHCAEVGAAGPVCFLEGGYVPEMAAKSIVATIKGLQGERPEFEKAASAEEKADVRETLEEAKPFWKGVL